MSDTANPSRVLILTATGPDSETLINRAKRRLSDYFDSWVRLLELPGEPSRILMPLPPGSMTEDGVEPAPDAIDRFVQMMLARTGFSMSVAGFIHAEIGDVPEEAIKQLPRSWSLFHITPGSEGYAGWMENRLRWLWVDAQANPLRVLVMASMDESSVEKAREKLLDAFPSPDLPRLLRCECNRAHEEPAKLCLPLWVLSTDGVVPDQAAVDRFSQAMLIRAGIPAVTARHMGSNIGYFPDSWWLSGPPLNYPPTPFPVDGAGISQLRKNWAETIEEGIGDA